MHSVMASKSGTILVVDDNAGIRKTLGLLLPLYFSRVETLASPAGVVSALERLHPEVVLLDMNFRAEVNTGNEGLFWLGEIKRVAPEVEVVLFTAYADIELAVEGMKRGAFDFLVKPWENGRLMAVLTAARDRACRRQQPAAAEAPPALFWGTSRPMEAIRRTVQKIAPTDATVLITGENGTGKELLAREIHARSLRSGGPMVAVDAGAIPETLFESELFGHEKGAFTDARSDRAGKFEQADGGTLFLDEIGNLPLHLQAKLLRVLQSRSVVRLGAAAEIPVDIRLICATNLDLEQQVRAGLFREDLYYRIHTLRLELPPLRERRDDIVPLAEQFAARFAARYHRPVEGLDDGAKEALVQCRWNGNIRELQNVVEQAVILAEGRLIGRGDLQLGPVGTGALQMRQAGGDGEERMVREAMERAGWNISAAARMLGVSRPTLYAKLKKYNL